jgi:8-oxo-dGTP pyrophosphatase MutT (NUDIX family)
MQLRRRPAARILLTNPLGQVLLFRFDHREGALAGKNYWATPGGGLEHGETYEQAAMRELSEETGIYIADPGPVIAERKIVLQLSNGDYVLEEEQYFHITVPTDSISVAGWSDEEVQCMTHYRWWSCDELEETQEAISPGNLVSILREKIL